MKRAEGYTSVDGEVVVRAECSALDVCVACMVVHEPKENPRNTTTARGPGRPAPAVLRWEFLAQGSNGTLPTAVCDEGRAIY